MTVLVSLRMNQHRLPSPFRADRRIGQLLVPDRLLVVKNGLNGSGILCRMDPIVLYVDGFWNSPYAFSVFVCLKEKGLPFETARGEPARAGAEDAGVPGEVAHGARPGAGARGVPAVRVERDRRVPGGDVRAAALPGDAAGRAADRARARQIMAWIRSDLMPIREERVDAHVLLQAPGAAAVAGGEGGGGQVDRGGVGVHPRRAHVAVRRVQHRRRRSGDDADAPGRQRRSRAARSCATSSPRSGSGRACAPGSTHERAPYVPY